MRLSNWRAAAAIGAAVTLTAAGSPAIATGERAAAPRPSVFGELTGDPHDHTEHTDIDHRTGAVAPTAAQRGFAPGGGQVRWNKLGTPASLAPARGALASGLPADPVEAAREYLRGSTALFGLAPARVDSLTTVANVPIGKGHVVLLRQRYGDLDAAYDGLVAVAVKDGSVLRVNSSLARDDRAPQPATVDAEAALAVAAKDARISLGADTRSRVKLVAVPTPADGPRAAYQVVLISDDAADPKGYTTYVDARTSKILVREDFVDSFEPTGGLDPDNPSWSVFPGTPTSTTDNRQRWCLATAPGCTRLVEDPATGKPWDLDLTTGLPTNSTQGNSAFAAETWSGGTSGAPPTAADRNYSFPWTNQWAKNKCDPASFDSPERNDVDAASANLFAMHNRMHDWAYHLGFTEQTWNLQNVQVTGQGKGADAEQGRTQAGARVGLRNNANQSSPPDGIKPMTNMYLWQPAAGSVYPPCVDGDFDMTVIGHEYTHAISNRMIAGPDASIGSFQGGAMGESWSDLMAMEYLFESNIFPAGNSRYVTGAYVTGDRAAGIRNYDMSANPLNYSNVGYDMSGPGVHADGEIWSATQFDIRKALLARYGAGTPALQESCAAGATPATECPGNRRWAQLVFDSFLLQASGSFSMLDMRDNMLTADALRFEGANYDLLWNAYASRGYGSGATSGPSDFDPVPSFASPTATNVEVTFKPLGAATGKPVRLFVGAYEAKAVPIADTDPATALPDTATMVPGTYDFVAVGAGFGHKRITQTIRPGASQVLPALMTANLASTAAGATISGDGFGHAALTDETENTGWTAADGVAGKQVTVDLAGDTAALVGRVQVSALTRPFTALRSFEVLTCNAAAGGDCTQDSAYKVVHTSAADAFPGGAFRPKTPQLTLRSFNVRPSTATHVRLRALTSQCTGGPLYAGDQDNDPATQTDCSASLNGRSVQAAEFQVFSS